jgi:hypothetical protein
MLTTARRRTGGVLKRLLPVVVSAVALGWVLGHFDTEKIKGAASRPEVLGVLLPALLLYGAATLALESGSILALVDRRPHGFGAWTAARVKCASYLLATVNYALGGAALSVLLRRRAGIGLGEAAGVVLLISAVDLLVVLGLGALAATTVGAEGPAVRAGLVAVAAVGFFGGLVLLRAPASLGPLERLRQLAVFEALRVTPWPRLGRLTALRVLFSACFIGLAAAAFQPSSAPFPSPSRASARGRSPRCTSSTGSPRTRP